MISKLPSLLAIACTLAVSVLAPHAMAQEAYPAGMPAISDGELSDLRGGFYTVDGYTFDFGAVVRTTVDGMPALEQRLTWTPDGVLVQDAAGMPSVQLSSVGGIGLDLSDTTGTTLVGHRLADGQLQGFIVNSANNRDIGQDIQINLTLPGFEALQRDMLAERLGMRIDFDVAAGLVAASGQ